MKTIRMNVISGWNVIKIIRVVAGIFILLSGINENNITFVLPGSVFLLFALITPGVCWAMYNPPTHQNTPVDINDTEYEELGAK
jgi:hypothetical protein